MKAEPRDANDENQRTAVMALLEVFFAMCAKMNDIIITIFTGNFLKLLTFGNNVRQQNVKSKGKSHFLIKHTAVE